MDIDVLIELPELMINRNMRCIEISNTRSEERRVGKECL